MLAVHKSELSTGARAARRLTAMDTSVKPLTSMKYTVKKRKVMYSRPPSSVAWSMRGLRKSVQAAKIVAASCTAHACATQQTAMLPWARIQSADVSLGAIRAFSSVVGALGQRYKQAVMVFIPRSAIISAMTSTQVF